jgi:hypothetical protein
VEGQWWGEEKGCHAGQVQGHAKTGIFLSHANTKHAGNAWQNAFAPLCGAAARGGDAFNLQYARITTIAGKDPATNCVSALRQLEYVVVTKVKRLSI